MKPLPLDDYAHQYDCVSMRSKDTILQVTMHAKGQRTNPASRASHTRNCLLLSMTSLVTARTAA